MCNVAQEVLGIHSKDVITNEAKCHASCYKSIVRNSNSINSHKRNDLIEDKSLGNVDMGEDIVESLCNTAYAFCENHSDSLKVVEFQNIRKIALSEAAKLKAVMTESQHKNLPRKIPKRFENHLFHSISP